MGWLKLRSNAKATPHCTRQVPTLNVRTGFHQPSGSYTVAALSSLIAMIEMATRILIDTGLPRRRAVTLVGGAAIICGTPSAVSLAVFENQDWVWGIALMISGLFISLAATKYGQQRFREELVNVEGNDLNVGRFYEWILKYLVPAEFVVMFS